MAFAAGQKLTAADLQTLQDGLTVVENNSIGTAATNFTTVSATARTIGAGKVINIVLYITSTNALTATSGNISDTLMFTVNAPYRPTTDTFVSVAGNGSVTGEAILNTAGQVFLRALSDSSGAGSNFRLSFSFINA